MKRYSCVTHSIIILIPDTKKEFHEGKYHQDIEKCVSHNKKFPSCEFIEIGEES